MNNHALTEISQPYRILIVDDEVSHLAMEREILRGAQYCVTEASSAKEALEWLRKEEFDVVLADKRMPGMDGDELCRCIRDDLGLNLLPVIMVTASNSRKELLRSLNAGANDFIHKPYNTAELIARTNNYASYKRLTDQMENTESLLFALARMVEARDKNTGDHCSRLAHTSVVIGKAMGLSAKELIALRRGGVLHDIGKLGIPDSILLKKGPLNDKEWDIMRQHTVIGAELLSGLRNMQLTIPIVRNHHEAWNGSGYPDGLRGEEIPLLARVFQIADIYDALAYERPYKPIFSLQKIITIFEDEVGKGLRDPAVTAVFLNILRSSPKDLELPAATHPDTKDSNGEDIFKRIIMEKDALSPPANLVAGKKNMTKLTDSNETSTQATGLVLNGIQQSTLYNVIHQHAIVSITNIAGIITHVNDKFCSISGYTQAELIGKNHRLIQSGKHSKQFFHELWQTISQGNTWQGLIENKNKDGKPYWVQTTIAPILDEKGKPQQYLSIRTDVSAQELTKRKLQHFKQTLDQTLDCIFIFDAETLRFSYVNKGAVKQLGYSEGELLNMTALNIKPDFTEVTFREQISPLINEKHSSQLFETVHAHKSGKLIPVEIFLQYFPSSINNDSQFIAIVRDITDKKIIEQEQREIEVRSHRVQKMEVIGQLTAGIAHDFNNILACIMGYTDLALTVCVDNNHNKLKKYLERVYSASERGRDLVLQMLNFSHKGEVDLAPMNPLPVIRETIKMLQSTFPARVEIIFEATSEDVPYISIVAVQLQQLIMNLSLNARDAMMGKGKITLSLRSVSSEAITCDSCYRHLELENFVELTVSDNGLGIEPNFIEKLFEPFYTTKDVGEGTGLGLFVVHSIIHEYEGHLVVESLPNKGTTFRLFFPAVTVSDYEKNSHHGTCNIPSLAEHAGKHILIVDDEKHLLSVMSGILEIKNFTTHSYSDSREALAFFKQNPQQIDLVITDLSMPNLDGMELAYELRNQRSDIPIIVCSGYSDKMNKSNVIDYGLNGFLPKPSSKAALLTLVAEVFNGINK